MKQKDAALIIVIAFVSAIISLVLSNMIITAPKNRSAKVTIVDKIDASFPIPDTKYFNDQSFDPTRLIFIQDNSNPSNPTTPFH